MGHFHSRWLLLSITNVLTHEFCQLILIDTSMHVFTSVIFYLKIGKCCTNAMWLSFIFETFVFSNLLD